MDFEKIIEDKVQECVKVTLENCIDSIYGSSYGEFGTALKDEIKKNISINLDNINIPQYNTLIQKSFNKAINDNIGNKFDASINELTNKVFMIDLKETYDLSDLLEKFKDSYGYGHDEEITLHLSEHYGSITIYLDASEHCENYACNYRIFVGKDGTIFSLKMKDKDLDDCMLDRSNSDSLLVNIFLQGKKIKFDRGKDPDDYDLGWDEESCD